jgi:putative SOS response-associated peptidase YedK
VIFQSTKSALFQSPIHDRMPVILPREAERSGSARRLRAKANCIAVDDMAGRADADVSLSPRVNSGKNDNVGLIEPVLTTSGRESVGAN